MQADHRDASHPAKADEVIGRVTSVRGSEASVGLPASAPGGAVRVTVGKLVGVQAGDSLLIGAVTDVSLQTQPAFREQGFGGAARLDVFGEIVDYGGPDARFRRGVG